MNSAENPRWLGWTTRLQAIAQNGLTFAHDPYDVERYAAIREILAEMIAAGSDQDIAVIRDLLGKDSGYATPKVDVRGVVFRDGRLLFVRERSDGKWSLPGGWADVGESPAESVTREVFEESGFETRAAKVLAIFDRSKHPHVPAFPCHVYKKFIRCSIIGGAAAHSSETEGVNFFSETALPDLSVTRITPWQVRRLFEHHRNPDLPTDFDNEAEPDAAPDGGPAAPLGDSGVVEGPPSGN
jgi:ADP-ribose pyrophosphatase YjhB (NUDIX family)